MAANKSEIDKLVAEATSLTAEAQPEQDDEATMLKSLTDAYAVLAKSVSDDEDEDDDVVEDEDEDDGAEDDEAEDDDDDDDDEDGDDTDTQPPAKMSKSEQAAADAVLELFDGPDAVEVATAIDSNPAVMALANAYANVAGEQGEMIKSLTAQVEELRSGVAALLQLGIVDMKKSQTATTPSAVPAYEGGMPPVVIIPAPSAKMRKSQAAADTQYAVAQERVGELIKSHRLNMVKATSAMLERDWQGAVRNIATPALAAYVLQDTDDFPRLG